MRYWRRCCWRRSSWFWIGSKLRGELTIFVLAGAALIPLSWLIGEAMDNLARHTGPGIGGFLNATFGNAPELIIAVIAVSEGLTEIVRASLVGSSSWWPWASRLSCPRSC